MKLKRESIVNIFASILSTIFILSSTLSSNGLGEYVVIRNISLILLFLYCIIIAIMKNISVEIKLNILNLIWICFGTVVLISCMNSKEGIITGIVSFFVVPFLYFYLFNSIFKDNLLNIIVEGFFYAYLMIITLSLAINPITYPYMGIFKNPNPMGLTTCGFILITLVKLNNSNKLKKIYYMLILISLAIVAQTGSRTSLIISIFIILINSLFKFKARINLSKFLKLYIAIPIIALMGAVALYKYIYIFEGIISKTSKSEELLSGRTEIWENILAHSSILGNGEQFAVGSHNTFLQIFATYGIIAFILFIFITLINLYCAIKSKRKNLKYSDFNILINVVFICASMTEGIYSPIGNGIVFSWIVVYGYNMYSLKKLSSLNGGLECERQSINYNSRV